MGKQADHSEFRRYRHLIAALYFSFIGLGAALLIASVVYQLFSKPASTPELPHQSLSQCHTNLKELLSSLNKAATQQMTPGTRPSSWDDFMSQWTREWSNVGEQCRFRDREPTAQGPARDILHNLHTSLPDIGRRYGRVLARYDATLADELDRAQAGLERSRQLLER